MIKIQSNLPEEHQLQIKYAKFDVRDVKDMKIESMQEFTIFVLLVPRN